MTELASDEAERERGEQLLEQPTAAELAESAPESDLPEQRADRQRRHSLYLLLLVVALIVFIAGPLAARWVAGGLFLPLSIGTCLALLLSLLGLALFEGASRR